MTRSTRPGEDGGRRPTPQDQPVARVVSLPTPQALSRATAWLDHGPSPWTIPCPTPARAWERRLPSGRVQRLLLAQGPEVSTLVVWGALEPVSPHEWQTWDSLVRRAMRGTGPTEPEDWLA